MRLYGITGWKDSGKTHLVARLVALFSARGLAVSTIKHAHHSAETDRAGTDSHRHREAGAREVILASPARWALMGELRGAPEPGLEELLARLSPVDLVLIEGYKATPHPKIEAHRSATGKGLLAAENPTIRAVASDADVATVLPTFRLDDTAGIADFILREVGL